MKTLTQTLTGDLVPTFCSLSPKPNPKLEVGRLPHLVFTKYIRMSFISHTDPGYYSPKGRNGLHSHWGVQSACHYQVCGVLICIF
eukprot:992020-Amorphochlora_amoeboformis.AAC.1